MKSIEPISKEKILPIQDLRTFFNVREKILKEDRVIQPRDKFLIELLDLLAVKPANVFEINDINTINIRSKEIWEEYKKLSEVVHTPIFIDFPPFSSILEYIGIVHHLRKVRYNLEKVITNYSKLIKRKKRKQ
ncbi:hypothetical protein [Ferroglobus placidus]|uniref:hypothetical protein n=1 Tax=Ferroglobus placidus TaxID=54261 RepID=UPI00064FD7DF|nr:hypothetical protein [Ferroglobus placidus]